MAPSLPTIVARARRGDERAIAYLLTQSLRSQGIVARGQWQGRTLVLDLEAEAAIDRAQAVAHIRRGLGRLEVAAPIAAVQVRGRRRGQPQGDWQEDFAVAAAAATPTLPAPEPEVSPQRSPEPPPEVQPPQAQPPQVQSLQEQPIQGPDGGDRPPVSAPPAAPPPQAPPAEAPTYLSDRTLAALAHLAPLASYLVVGSQWLGGWPLFWGGSFLLPWRVVAPLALLLIPSPGPGGSDTQRQAKAALNFQLTMLIAWVVTIALMFILVGFLLVIPLALLEIICCVVAAVNASEGKPARYPAIPFVR